MTRPEDNFLANLCVPGAEHFFEHYFGAPRHTDAQETISSPIIFCFANLTVPGGFLNPLSTFLRTVLVDSDTLILKNVGSGSKTPRYIQIREVVITWASACRGALK